MKKDMEIEAEEGEGKNTKVKSRNDRGQKREWDQRAETTEGGGKQMRHSSGGGEVEGGKFRKDGGLMEIK